METIAEQGAVGIDYGGVAELKQRTTPRGGARLCLCGSVPNQLAGSSPSYYIFILSQ
jgi:hypothetical protein